MTYVPSDLRDRITTIVEDCCIKASQHFDKPVTYPVIQYNKKGKTAGTANYSTWVLNFNPILLTENVEAFLKRTVVHEIAHLITRTIYPGSSAHGQEWKSVMVFLGAEPSRCHSYDISNASTRKQFDYICPKCDTILKVSSVIHKRIRRQDQRRFHNGCGNTHPIKLVKEIDKTPIKQQIAADAPTIHSNTKVSKKDRARKIFKENSIKSLCIHDLMTELQMSKAGANTYYYNFKSLKW